MNPQLKAAGASSVAATIERLDGGGFVAVVSDGETDRDGEIVLPYALFPLPESIPVHLDHTMRAASVVARGRPYYDLDRLMIDAVFASTGDAQEVRQKVAEGVLDSLSIVFIGKEWRDIDGVRTCVKGELLAADLVSVPSNSRARVLSVRSLRPGGYGDAARELIAESVLDMARAEAVLAKKMLSATDSRGQARRQVDDMLAEIGENRSARDYVRTFLRGI